MFRYIALSWHKNHSNQHAFAQHLLASLQPLSGGVLHSIAADFKVFTQGAEPGCVCQQLPASMGMVLGAIYRPPDSPTLIQPCPPLCLTREQAARTLDTQGHWLIDNAWGSYIALLCDPGNHHRYVITSPGGDLPCHISHQQGVTLAFSDIQPLLHIRALKFAINEDYLQSRLALGGLSSHPPLIGVRPAHRGECLSLQGPADGPRRFHWHPRKFSEASERIEDPVQAAERLRATVHSCTHTLIAPHENSLLRLSGGLDSSIIAGCLNTRPRPGKLTSHTFHIPGARSQELRWAEMVVQRHGFDHRPVAVESSAVSLETMLQLRPLMEPTPTLQYIMRSTFEHSIATECRATAVFTGDGGDSGFCGETYAYALAEHLQHHGPGLQMFSLAAQIAALTQQSSWTVLRRSIRRWRQGAGMQQHQQAILPTLKLLNPQLLDITVQQARYPHPWFNHLERVPWPLIYRLGMLTSLPQPYSVADPDTAPQIIAPLYAQPVMELLLRIPIYVHFQEGRERGLARRAFEPDLPRQIAQRRWKDRPVNFLNQWMRVHRPFLQALLLDGELVRRNLLDRTALTQALEGSLSDSTVQPVETLRYLDYEFWLRAWRSLAA